MSGREWKPGDVAWIRVGTGDWEVGLFQDDETWACAHTQPRKDYEDVQASHPLVVIDPEDREQVERLSQAMHESDHIAPWHDLHHETRGAIENAMQAALRSLITPPRPEEPTGKYAIVVADGVTWCRAAWASEKPWSRIGTEVFSAWDEMAVESVEFKGVTQ